jgi:hypothetical protein
MFVAFFCAAIDRNILAPKNSWAVTIEMRGETRPRPRHHVQCLLLLYDFSQKRNIWKKKLPISAVLALLYVGRRKDNHSETDSQIFRHKWRKALISFDLSLRPRLSVSACVTTAVTDRSSWN